MEAERERNTKRRDRDRRDTDRDTLLPAQMAFLRKAYFLGLTFLICRSTSCI